MGQRIRTVKPGCWADEEISSCSRDARLLFVVLITFADDDGRFRDLPAQIIGFGYPEDDDIAPRKVTAWMDELVATGVLVRYEVNAKRYATFPNWHKHQVINRYTPSVLPPCPVSAGVLIVLHKSRAKRTDDSVSGTGASTDLSLPEGKEERGREKAPPTPLAAVGSDEPPPKPASRRKRDVEQWRKDVSDWEQANAPAMPTVEQAAAWSAAQEALRHAVPQETFDVWLSSLTLLGVSPDGVLVIGCSDETRSWIADRFAGVLSSALGGAPYRLAPIPEASSEGEAAA